MLLKIYVSITSDINKKHVLLVSTLSPFCSLDIVTDLPFSRLTLTVDGKHAGGGGGGGGGGGSGDVVVTTRQT